MKDSDKQEACMKDFLIMLNNFLVMVSGQERL